MWQTIKREELYEQVWSMPLSQLCEKYGLSDNGLRKVCKRLNVPIPWRGYWAKVEAGHKVKKTALPSGAEQSSTQIWRQPKREKTAADEGDVAWLKEREAYESDAAHAIDVVAVRKRWHAAIAPLHASLEQEAREIEASRKAQERYDAWPEWRRQRESGSDRMAWLWYERAGRLFPATHHASVVRLSLAQFRRGLAILNAVAVAATKRGFEVTCDDIARVLARVCLERGEILLYPRFIGREVEPQGAYECFELSAQQDRCGGELVPLHQQHDADAVLQGRGDRSLCQQVTMRADLGLATEDVVERRVESH